MQSERKLSCVLGHELFTALEGAHRGERKHLVEFLRILAEIDARKLYVERGFSSSFVFLRDGLSMSEDQAYRRVATARVGRKFPRVFAMIEAGELHMTGVSKLAKHLTHDNHTELLDAARHRSKEQIEVLIATRFPSPPAKTSVRRTTTTPTAPRSTEDAQGGSDAGAPPTPEAAPQPADRRPGAPSTEPTPAAGASPSPAALEPPAPPRRAPPSTVSPTSASTYTFRFSGSERAKALLERAQDWLPHGTEVGEVFERALELLVQDLEKKKFKTTNKPRTAPPEDAPAGERYVPAAVKREVYTRDEGQCTYVSPEGRRCGETSHLEFDHIFPVALGGNSTVDNVRLRCRAHNQYAAEVVFGPRFMEKKRSTWPGPGSDPPPAYSGRDGEAKPRRTPAERWPEAEAPSSQ
jgi:hypothetical protein